MGEEVRDLRLVTKDSCHGSVTKTEEIWKK